MKCPKVSPVIKNRSIVIFTFHPGENCYGICRVQASVVGNLNVTGIATRELIRAFRMSIRAWCELYIAWYSRRVVVGADITCSVSPMEWIQSSRNRKFVCQQRRPKNSLMKPISRGLFQEQFAILRTVPSNIEVCLRTLWHYAEKEDLSKGYWNSKRNLGVTTHMEIFYKMELNYFEKCAVTPNFLDGFQQLLLWSSFPT